MISDREYQRAAGGTQSGRTRNRKGGVKKKDRIVEENGTKGISASSTLATKRETRL